MQSGAALLSHPCSLQHVGALGQDKALSVHLSWPPHAGVSSKYECWRASSASADAKLNVVSPSHNLPIPAVSWDEQKHAGVRMGKVTLLNNFSLCSWMQLVRNSWKELRQEQVKERMRFMHLMTAMWLVWEAPWQVLCWGATPTLMLTVEEKTHTRKPTSDRKFPTLLLATSRNRWGPRISEWIGMQWKEPLLLLSSLQHVKLCFGKV